MTDQPTPCRSTQHCATHDFCHRCTPSLDEATQHLVKAIDAAGITTGTGRVYAALAATVRDAARQTTPHACGNCDGIDPASCLTNPDRAPSADLRDQYARAIRDAVRVRLGTNALRLAQEGHPVMLNMSEAEAAADAVLAVQDAARQTTGQTDTDCPACQAGIEHTDHCPIPETHNWGCGCPTDNQPVEQCGAWGGCILRTGHAGPHRLTPRPAVGQLATHPGYDIAGYPETHAGPREKCPDPACETDQHANCGAECPAVGQPAEAQPADEARPPRSTWRVEGHDVDRWLPLGMPEEDRETADAKRTAWNLRLPDTPTRLVREDTTWTVEDETR